MINKTDIENPEPLDAYRARRFVVNLAYLLCFALLIVLLSWPALYNGQPFFFEDTSAYIRGVDAAITKFTGMSTHWGGLDRLASRAYDANEKFQSSSQAQNFVISGRSAYYGLFLYIADSYGSLWTVVFIQAGIVLLSLYLTFSQLDILSCRSLSGFVFVLAALTSVGFYTSFLMPDIFSAVSILAYANLVAFGSRLTWLKTATWFVMLCLGALFHSSNILILGFCSIAAICVAAFGRKIATVGIVCGVLAVVIGFLGETAFDRGVEATLGIRPTRPPFLMARLVADGPGLNYLKSHCPSANLTVCRYVSSLRSFPSYSDTFLWSKDPLKGGVFIPADPASRRALSREQYQFAWATFLNDPKGVLRAILTNVANQATLVGVSEFAYDSEERREELRDRLPKPHLDALELSSAWHDGFSVKYISIIIGSFALISMVAFLVSAIRLRMNRAGPNQQACNFAIVLICGIVANTIVCGTLSTPHDRYGARVVWLLPLSVLALTRVRATKVSNRSGNPGHPS